jgi:nucleoside phosphorylase
VGHSVTSVLVVAATDRELAVGEGWLTLRCGVGPVEAAAMTAAAIARTTPRLILHVGIAGARRAAALSPPALVIGDQSRYCDLSVPATLAPSIVQVPPHLVASARRALPEAVVRAIGTSGTIGGTSGCDVEAMEGFGVLRAAELAGVAALEVRAISNAIEDAERSLWRFDEAFAAVLEATPRLVMELSRG